ncbi:MAG: O-antigen ligase family protein [Candidatus Cloacimonetes bacterium]|nr:O-antigen ligase family protein [Candidatus Cloacimonadota bacterium]
MHITERIDVKKILLYFLIMIFAYSISGAVFKVLAEKTLGSVARGIMPTLPILFLIVLVTLYDTRRLSFANSPPRIPQKISIKPFLRKIIWVIILAVPLGIFVNQYFSRIGTMYTSIIIFSLVAFILSIYYIIRGNFLNATVIFLIILPFLMFLSRDILWGSEFTTYHSNTSQQGIIMALSGYYLFIMYIFYLISKNQSKVRYNVENTLLIKLTYFIVIYSLFSVFFSKDIITSFFYYLMEITAPVVFFIFLLKAMNKTKDIIFLVKIMTFCVFLYSFFGIYFILLGQAEEVFEKGLHEFATVMEFMTSPYLGMVATYGVFLSLINIKNDKRFILKTILIILTIFLIMIIIWNNARSSQVGLLLGLGYLLVVSNIRMTKKVYIAITAVVISVILYLLVFEKFMLALYNIRTLETIGNITTGKPIYYLFFNRFELWKEAVEMIKDHPFFGIGAGMWKEYTFIYGEKLYTFPDIHNIWRWTSSTDAHNQFLMFAVNYGNPILLSFCTIIFLIFKKAALLVKKGSDISKNILHGVMSVLIAWITISIFTRTFFWDGTILSGFAFWFVIAVVIKVGELEEKGLT